MSVTRDRSLKVCRQFPAFLLFLWQSMCQIVREWKKAIELLFRVSWVEGIVWKEKEKENEKRKRKRKRKEKEKEKKKEKEIEKKNQTFISSFGQFHRIPSILHTLLFCFKSGNLPKSYHGLLVFLTSRDRDPFCPGYVSLVYFLLMFHDKKLTTLLLFP